MHILILPSWYTTARNPIRGSFFRDQSLALQERGHQVGMLVPPSRFRTLNGIREFAANWHKSNQDITITQDSGITIYRIPWWGWLPSILPQLRGELVLKLFDRYCAEVGTPDILHGHSILYGGYLAAFIGQARHIPSIVTEHSSLFLTNGYQVGHSAFIRDTLANVDKVLAVSSTLAESLKRYKPDLNVELTGNVVDTTRFVPPEIPPPALPFVVSIFGRIDRNKAQDALIQAFAIALKGKTAQLQIVGDGSRRKTCEQLAQKLDIAAQTRFHGQVPREKVIPIMQQSHIVVSASYVETFGVTLAEAMACGKPVIATRSGGPQGFIEESVGLLVPPGNVDALAEALLKMYENHHQYEAASIRAKCVSRFSSEAIAKELEAFYGCLQSKH